MFINRRQSYLVSGHKEYREASKKSSRYKFFKREVNRVVRREPILIDEPENVRFKKKKDTAQFCGGNPKKRHLLIEKEMYRFLRVTTFWIMCENCGKKIDYIRKKNELYEHQPVN